VLCPLSAVSFPPPQLRRKLCCISIVKVLCAADASYLNFCVPLPARVLPLWQQWLWSVKILLVRLFRWQQLVFCTGVRFLVGHVCLAQVLVRRDIFGAMVKRLVASTIWSRWLGVRHPSSRLATLKVRLTQRAADLGYASRYLSVFVAGSFSVSAASPRSHPKRLTLTVSPLA